MSVWVLTHLKDMQEGGRLFPFASAPFRDFYIFGAGYDRLKGDYNDCYKWAGHSLAALPSSRDIDGCLKCLKEIQGDLDHPQMCQGVWAIITFLELLKAPHTSEVQAWFIPGIGILMIVARVGCSACKYRWVHAAGVRHVWQHAAHGIPRLRMFVAQAYELACA